MHGLPLSVPSDQPRRGLHSLYPEKPQPEGDSQLLFHDIDCEKPTPDWHYEDFAALVEKAKNGTEPGI